jgi:uncharacterized protein YegP (UPF0339 family)
MPNFVIQKSENHYWYFELYDTDGKLLLTGRPKMSQVACRAAILSVRINVFSLRNFEIRMTPGKEYFVVLHSVGTGELLASSGAYQERKACENLIEQVIAAVRKDG